MPSYALQTYVTQTEQLNGFWLIRFALNSESEPLPMEAALGKAFYFPEAPDSSLFLFQHSDHTSDKQLQFLSEHPLDTSLLNQVTELRTDSEQAWQLPSPQKPLLILGSNQHMANAFALAKQRQTLIEEAACSVMLASDTQFPFMVKPARFLMPKMPPEAIGACTLLEDWKIQNRLASKQGLPGCFDGDLLMFFDYWLQSMDHEMQQAGNVEEWQAVVFADNSTQKKCLEASQRYHWLNLSGIS